METNNHASPPKSRRFYGIQATTALRSSSFFHLPLHDRFFNDQILTIHRINSLTSLCLSLSASHPPPIRNHSPKSHHRHHLHHRCFLSMRAEREFILVAFPGQEEGFLRKSGRFLPETDDFRSRSPLSHWRSHRSPGSSPEPGPPHKSLHCSRRWVTLLGSTRKARIGAREREANYLNDRGRSKSISLAVTRT